MRKTVAVRAFGWSLALALVGAVVTVAACSDDEEARRLSRKGEACMITDDCAGGLSCVPLGGGPGGTCVTGEFKIARTARECVLEQCSQPTDCCPTPPSNCADLQARCQDAGFGSGSESSCRSYDTLCKCDVLRYSCDNNRCRESRCVNDNDCSSSAPRCAGGKCVQCLDDAACKPGDICLNGTCTPPCINDGDCPGFQRCKDRKCEASGCATDRECVAATKNVEATCGTDHTCIVPCQTDLECGSASNYKFFSCIDRQCVFVGCNTDKDCSLYLESGGTIAFDGGSFSLGGKRHVICRDKVLTTGTTQTPR